MLGDRLARFVMALMLTACARSDSSDSAADQGHSESDGSTGSDSDSSETGDSADTTGDGGELPPNCGWNGSGYACSFTGADPEGTPIACPGPMEIGPCSAGDELQSCCDGEGNAWQCVCDGQACDYWWRKTDCAHAPGAGECGWWADWGTYVCGGEGEDPDGTPMSCAPDLTVGDACVPAEDPSCCDADGNMWECITDEFAGTSTWAVWDC